MTKQEFATLAMALKTYYPREKLIPNDKAMELWFRQLQDLEFKVAEAALYKWVATNRWAPKISEIREMAAEITRGEIPDWGEAWEQVLKAIGRFGSYTLYMEHRHGTCCGHCRRHRHDLGRYLSYVAYS